MFDYFNKVDDNIPQMGVSTLTSNVSPPQSIGQRIQAGPNSLTATGGLQATPSVWDKTVNVIKQPFAAKSDIGALHSGINDVDFDDPSNDEYLGLIANEEAGGASDDDGLPWKDILGSAAKALSMIDNSSTSRSSAFRPGFKQANIPAGQFDAGAIQNQMAAQQFQQQAVSGPQLNPGSLESLMKSIS